MPQKIEVYGIEKSKATVSLLIDLIKQAEQSGKDGWQFTDLLAFIGKTAEINDVIKSIPQIKLELKDLSVPERTEFYNYFVVKFSIPNKKVEAFVEHVLDYGIRLAAMIKEAVDIVAEYKALKEKLPVL